MGFVLDFFVLIRMYIVIIEKLYICFINMFVFIILYVEIVKYELYFILEFL